MKITFDNEEEHQQLLVTLEWSSVCPGEIGLREAKSECIRRMPEKDAGRNHGRCRACWDAAIRDAADMKIEGEVDKSEDHL